MSQKTFLADTRVYSFTADARDTQLADTRLLSFTVDARAYSLSADARDNTFNVDGTYVSEATYTETSRLINADAWPLLLETGDHFLRD